MRHRQPGHEKATVGTRVAALLVLALMINCAGLTPSRAAALTDQSMDDQVIAAFSLPDSDGGPATATCHAKAHIAALQLDAGPGAVPGTDKSIVVSLSQQRM